MRGNRIRRADIPVCYRRASCPAGVFVANLLLSQKPPPGEDARREQTGMSALRVLQMGDVSEFSIAVRTFLKLPVATHRSRCPGRRCIGRVNNRHLSFMGSITAPGR